MARVPLIKFGRHAAKAAGPHPLASLYGPTMTAPAASANTSAPSSATTATSGNVRVIQYAPFAELPPAYQLLPFSTAEMDAIEVISFMLISNCAFHVIFVQMGGAGHVMK